MKLLLVVCVLIAAFQSSKARIFTRCELAKVLLSNGFAKNQLPNWVCLVESESHRNTGARGPINTDGSHDYGLFQINDRYWCKMGSVGGDCHANCNSFLDNNITDDCKCALHIFKIHGFKAWSGWKAHCQKNLPDLRSCGI